MDPRYSSSRPTAGIAHPDPGMMSKAQSVLFILAILVLLTVASGQLWDLGYNYQGVQGSPLTKIHPATYMMVLTFAWVCIAGGNPLIPLVDMARRRPASLLLFVAFVVLFVQTVSLAAPGMAGLIDAFMMPALLSMLFAKTKTWAREKIEQVVHCALVANGTLGLVEMLTKHLTFPFRIDGEVFPYDTRSTALIGHPLGNATVTAVYVLALVAGAGNLTPLVRIAVIVLEIAAMVAFGGRVALVVSLVLTSLASLRVLHRVLRSGRVSLLGAAFAILALTLVPLVIMGLSVGGFFDALLQRFENDGGSANARIQMMDVVRAIPFRELMIGPDGVQVQDLRWANGLEMGIEHPFVYTVLYQGLVVAVFATLAVGLYLYEISRWSRPGMALPMVAFLIIINTFESLAGKSTLLALFAIIMLALYRPMTAAEPSPRRVPSARPPPSLRFAASQRQPR